MDETTLRTLLDSALAGEPPVGPGADNALRAGIRLRRRRVLGAAGSMAVAAAIAVAIPVVTGPLAVPPASGQHPASTWPIHGSANVPPPDTSVLRWRAVARDRASIVKITGEARTTCGRSLEGSGFVISPQHVLTNAHVVAGMTTGPYVGHGTGNGLPAKVVLFDPNTDVAILYVPGLRAPPLRFAGPAGRGSGAVMAGYPENGRFRAVPARIGSQWSANGPNIYQTGTVTRAIYAVRARVEPGNSGGPLLARNGKVYGVIFAASTTARNTGKVYGVFVAPSAPAPDTSTTAPDNGLALTADTVGPDVRHGARATTPVSTRGCPRPG
jgi:S1-C subfamily serine protease